MCPTLAESVESLQESITQLKENGATKGRSIGRLIQEAAEYANTYPIPNLAVEVCLGAFNEAVKERLDKKTSATLMEKVGRIAYCGMLPKLSNRECIRDFIACVTHGMALGIIPDKAGAHLLYGAQVAQSALPAVRKWRKSCTQTAPKQPSKSPLTPSTTTT